MRLFLAATASLLLAFAPVAAGQQSPSNPDLDEIRSQLKQTAELLQQTRQELQSSREEVRQLRAEVASIKTAAPSPATATETHAASQEQVDQLSEAQAVTDSRLEQLYQTKVESGSKYRVKLSGLILFNAGVNRGNVENTDAPQLALRPQAGQTAGDINATMRQTLFTLGVTGPEWLGAKTSADVDFDFFGGLPDTLEGNVLGVMRLRTGHARLQWENASLSVEQDSPFISPLGPTSLAAIGTPAFGYSGNLWTWTPQIVAARKFRWSENVHSNMQIGLLDPFNGEVPADSFDRDPEAGERSRTPAVAARHELGFNVAGRAFAIGVGGLYARQNYGYGRKVNEFAATVDWMMPLARQWELSGEFFRGRAIGGLWGGVGTSIVADGSLSNAASHVFPVNAIGGWTQLKFKPVEKWEFNSAFGIDNPYSADLRHYAAGSTLYRPTLRNSSEIFNVIHHPRSNLVLSLEYRHLNTINFTQHRYTAESVNLGIGVHF